MLLSKESTDTRTFHNEKRNVLRCSSQEYDSERIRRSPSNAAYYESGTLLSLPDDILSRIIEGNALSCRLVCRRLYKLVWRRCLLRDYTLQLSGGFDFVREWIYKHRWNTPTSSIALDLENIIDESDIETIAAQLSKVAGLKHVEIRNAVCGTLRAAQHIFSTPDLKSLSIPKSWWDAHPFQGHTHLLHLRITDCVRHIPLSFLKLIPRLKTLAISYSRDYSHLQHVPHLEELSLSQPYRFDFSRLSLVPRLKVLQIPAQQEGFEKVRDLKELHTIKLLDCSSGIDLRDLQHCPSLTAVDLSQCISSAWHYEVLSKFPLKSLSLHESCSETNSLIRYNGGTILHRSLEHLRFVGKGGSVSQNVLRWICSFQQLKSLTYSAPGLSSLNTDWNVLLQLNNLECLDVPNNLADPEFRVLAKMENLRNLRLSGDNITNGKKLMSLTKLKRLHLPHSTKWLERNLSMAIPECRITFGTPLTAE
ncbi:putative internalin A [Planoprotostelium fungivorum]|uniref:Putative internalin A n=1 Tax=Planoprotostelium fungivorum TaxID=1890364 RepID=A0A2P6N6Y7_9EUKA|nr:putative internalin A [Planoprotostelium fungivorum]